MASSVLHPLKRVQQWATFTRMWYLYDCKWQNPFHSADKVVTVLSGRNKPIYHALSDCGDHVVLINTQEIAMPEQEWLRRVYFHHTGFPGGASWTLAWQLHEKDPTMIMWKAVYKAIGGNLLRHTRMTRLHCFPHEEVTPEILQNVSSQIRQLRVKPKHINDYAQQEKETFPSVYDWPKDYILK